MTAAARLRFFFLRHAPPVLFIALIGIVSLLSPRFLSAGNLLNVLVQSSAIGIAAAGATFVLLAAGIDLSVGAVMYFAAAVAGKLILGEPAVPVPAALGLMVAIGLGWGWLNGTVITRFGIAPFIVTLAALFIGRGLGLLITETRAMNLPDSFREIATRRFLEIPSPVWVFAAVVAAAHVVLTRTAFGRHIYAIGNDREGARRAGIPVDRVVRRTYVISAFLAVAGGIVALAQLSAVSPTFGEGREFDAIAAAVLGGTSLFGGRGSVFPGTVIGAITIQLVYNALNLVDADPYCYPLITSSVVFLAVWINTSRRRHLERSARRPA